MHSSSHLADWLAGFCLINPLGLAHWLAGQLSLHAVEAALAHIAAIIGPIGQMIGLFLLSVKFAPYVRRGFRALRRGGEKRK